MSVPLSSASAGQPASPPTAPRLLAPPADPGPAPARGRRPAHIPPKVIVSVSLGSSKRNRRAETTLLGTPVIIERIGADGDPQKLRRLLQELDGRVDALGLGGADLGVTVQGHYYAFKSLETLIAGLRTPVVDGSVLRQTLERRCIQRAEAHFAQAAPAREGARRALVPTAAQHHNLALSLRDARYSLLLGDLGFVLGLPLALRSLQMLDLAARALLPWVSQMPFETLTPARQRSPLLRARMRRWIEWATLIAGDLPVLWPVLPQNLSGKLVVTGAASAEERQEMQRRGVRVLITTMPRLAGQGFGPNAIEAALVAIAGAGRPLTAPEITAMIGEDGMPPTVELLGP